MTRLHTIRDTETDTLVDAGVHPFDTIAALRQHGLVPKELDLDTFEKVLRTMAVGSGLELKTGVTVRRVK